MRIGLIALMLAMVVVGCKERKSDVELFQEGPIKVNLTVDVRRGYEPLTVNFAGYLETEDASVSRTIEDVKWLISEPGGRKREVVSEEFNYQDASQNEKGAFYLTQNFYRAGKYRVRLILNEGQYVSSPVTIDVYQDPKLQRRRYN